MTSKYNLNYKNSNKTILNILLDSHSNSMKYVFSLVLQQYWFDVYRAIQSVQDKAQIEANGHSLSKACNSVKSTLSCSLQNAPSG